MNNQFTKRKTLSKVRRNFLHKTPEDDGEEHEVQLLQEIDDQPFQMISTSVGLVERNRKLCVGVRFVNTYSSVHNVKIVNHASCTGVTFDIQLNENIPKIPWEYYVKRLESYGDLNLATWANRLRTHQTVYPKVVSELADLAKSQDQMIYANLTKMKQRVAMAHQEIQDNYPYKCVTIFSNKHETKPISAVYSDRFLREIEHDPEEFAEWVKENGIPRVFKGESPLHQEIGKAFLDCSLFQGGPVKYGPDVTTYIYDKNGRKKKAIVQLVLTIEPASEGVFVTGYAVLKGMDTKFGNKDLLDGNDLKCIKTQEKQRTINIVTTVHNNNEENIEENDEIEQREEKEKNEEIDEEKY